MGESEIGGVVIRELSGDLRELGVSGGRWAPRSEVEPLDLRHLWALPGLADAHTHLAADRLELEPGDPRRIRTRAFQALEGGVFLCLDKGWRDHSVLSLLALPPTRRPDLEAAGRMIASQGGYYPGFAVEVDEDGLVSAVAEEARTVGGWVKLVGDWPRKGRGALANFGMEALTRAVEVAHRAGARVAIHTMAPEVPTMAVRAGVDSIEHGMFLTEDDLTLLAERGGVWVPTLCRVEAIRDRLGADSSGGRLLSAGLDRVRDLLPMAEKVGVTVLAGSDLVFPPAQIGKEAVRLVEYGLSSAAAVAAASTAGMAHAGLDSGFEVGRPADLVAFAGNPMEEPAELTRPLVVIRRGRLIRADSAFP